MGNAPSSDRKRDRDRQRPGGRTSPRARTSAAMADRGMSMGMSWVIPLNRGGIPVLRHTRRPTRTPARPLFRKLGPVSENRPRLHNDDNNSMPSWSELRDYLLHGPLPSKKSAR